MERLRVGVVRYASVGAAIARAFEGHPAPECRIGGGRVTLIFRQVGSTEWPDAHKLSHALWAAQITREVFLNDRRRQVRARAQRGIVVRYEDVSAPQGYRVTARWECVIPAPEP